MAAEQGVVERLRGYVDAPSFGPSLVVNRNDLRVLADEAEQRNPKGWLAPMVREYLDVWR